MPARAWCDPAVSLDVSVTPIHDEGEEGLSWDTLPTEVEELRERTRRFVREVVIPAEPVPGQRLEEHVRRDLQAAARDADVFAPHVPVEHGGRGVPIEYWSPLFQEAGYSPIGPSALNCMAPDEGNMHMLAHIASPEQKTQFLDPLARGETRSCFAMTEPHPGAGSDPSALQTAAKRSAGGWVIDGHKRFTSGAIGAGFCIVMARTEASDATAGATMFLVPMSTPGMRVGEPIHTIDRTIDGGHPHLYLESVEVSDDAVLGEVGHGFRYAQVRLGPARLTHCMRWLGLARRALDIAVDRASTRELFGSVLSEQGQVQGLIAESMIDIESSDALTAKAASRIATDPKAGTALSSVAKVHCSDAVFRVIDRAVQVCGGDGVSDGLPLAQYLNEVRPFRIYDGPNETHKWAIARRAVESRKSAVVAGEPFMGDAAVRSASGIVG